MMKKIAIAGILLVSSLMLASIYPSAEKDEDPVVNRGLSWLASAQLSNGSWGAGSHQSTIKSEGAYQGDPATTAFSALALVRAGSTLSSGPYHEQVRKALDYLVEIALASPSGNPYLVPVTGTQPQVKLGNYIDVALTAQFLTRIMQETDEASINPDWREALQVCVQKLEMSQMENGSWSQAGWAGVLQSASAFRALENAVELGMETDSEVLTKAKAYQRGNVIVRGGLAEVSTGDAAGISLYTIAGNQRAMAREVQKAHKLIDQARKRGDLSKDSELKKEDFEKLEAPPQELESLWEAYESNKVVRDQLSDQQVLAGFGNYGGEEFLSYMMTSESMIIAGGKPWLEWSEEMDQRLSQIQNQDGSWSGHHCITSPVFCTAAALLTLTTSNDEQLLKYTGIEKK